jgi:hypothetical protein
VYKGAAAPLARALETGAKADVLWTTDSAAFEAIVMRALAG